MYIAGPCPLLLFAGGGKGLVLLDSPADFFLGKAPDLSFIWKNLLCIAFFCDKINYEIKSPKLQKCIYGGSN